jgi:uncharacterized spore protein YtfJ
MSEQDRTVLGMSMQNVGQVHDLIGRLFRVAEPGAVYSQPITSGDRTVVVTSEISMSVGAGVGFGHNTTPATVGAGANTAANTAAGVAGSVGGNGDTVAPGGRPAQAQDETGGGGGGGGFSFGRPVAAVVIEPNGVRVEPIVDPTKLGIAFFTTLGAMFFAWTSLRRATNQLAARQLAADTRAAARLERDVARQSKRQVKHEAKRAAKQVAAEAKKSAQKANAEAKKAAELAAKQAKEAERLAAKSVAEIAARAN